MSSKKLFFSAQSQIKKRKAFMLSQALIRDISHVEQSAEKYGVSFRLNELVEEAIERLVKQANAELRDIKASHTNHTTRPTNE